MRDQGLLARKRLGQHFLQDRGALAKILTAADIQPGDNVLEIGPGTGVLTQLLAEQAGKLVAVELDDRLFQLLTETFESDPNVHIVHGNALDIDPCTLFAGAYKVVANIPYYITGPLLRHFLEAGCPPVLLVLMVQLEVARRITAKPGDLSLLGLSVQWYAEPKLIARVPAGAFYPRPKVDSAIVRLTPHSNPLRQSRAERLFRLAHAAFGTRRKQLGNALSLGLGIDRDASRALLREAEIEPERRAETLTLEEWERLAGTQEAG
ncbi:MAG: 16S rRNA (adenine(1518)-N(6)/adenine(1519)-N(6))-dimethyltransferase RsmA [Chloroflexota bacterium]